VPKKEMLYFSSYLIHTLFNPSNTISRNITLKSPKGILDWKPAYKQQKNNKGKAEIIEGKTVHSKTGKTKNFIIKKKHYNYVIELIQLNKNKCIEETAIKDEYFFVVEGSLQAKSEETKKYAKKNDFIVIDKNTNFNLNTTKGCLLYHPIT
jgi:mannose-6-phosphate isomerase-like protein (cupin superfamily)